MVDDNESIPLLRPVATLLEAMRSVPDGFVIAVGPRVHSACADVERGKPPMEPDIETLEAVSRNPLWLATVIARAAEHGFVAGARPLTAASTVPDGRVSLDGDLLPAMPPAKAMLCLGEYCKGCSVHVKRCLRFGSLTHALYLMWVHLDGPNCQDGATCYLVFRDEQVDEGTESRPFTLSHVTHLLGNITEAELDAISTRPAGNPGRACMVTELAKHGDPSTEGPRERADPLENIVRECHEELRALVGHDHAALFIEGRCRGLAERLEAVSERLHFRAAHRDTREAEGPPDGTAPERALLRQALMALEKSVPQIRTWSDGQGFPEYNEGKAAIAALRAHLGATRSPNTATLDRVAFIEVLAKYRQLRACVRHMANDFHIGAKNGTALELQSQAREALHTTHLTEATRIAIRDDDTPNPGPESEQDEGSWSWCRRCRGVIRGPCMCTMYQDWIDTSGCVAHRDSGHVGRCRCSD